jgi:hypothetical protein
VRVPRSHRHQCNPKGGLSASLRDAQPRDSAAMPAGSEFVKESDRRFQIPDSRIVNPRRIRSNIHSESGIGPDFTQRRKEERRERREDQSNPLAAFLLRSLRSSLRLCVKPLVILNPFFHSLSVRLDDYVTAHAEKERFLGRGRHGAFGSFYTQGCRGFSTRSGCANNRRKGH